MNTVYKQTVEYARTHGELEQYRASLQENIACREAIEQAIGQGFDGMHLEKNCARSVLEKFGRERVMHVLANTIQIKVWDGRFSRENKQWAVTFGFSESQRHRLSFSVQSHPCVLNGFVDQAREAEMKRETPPLSRSSKPEKTEKPKTRLKKGNQWER